MPAALITADAVSQVYGDRQVLENVDLAIHAGDRTAVVGPNGSGKSTLLRILAGKESPSAGKLRMPAGLRVAYLPQVSAVRYPARTVREELSHRTGVDAALRNMNRETQRLGSGDLSRIEAQADAVEEWTRLGGPDLDARIGAALDPTGIDPAWAERSLGSLSGGQLARINLASLHLSRLDVALLDEPGNHLDAEGLEMLGDLLAGAGRAVVLASHDRSLLEAFATDVIEIERGRTRHFSGGWHTYLREKVADRNRARTEWEEATAEKRRLVGMERRIREQAAVGARKARKTGETDRFIRHMAIESAQKNTAISGISKRIETTEIPEKPWEEDLSRLLLEAADDVHTPRVAVASNVVVAAGTWRSREIDLSLAPGERLLLAGPNGSGKSSLLSMLAGRSEPASGQLLIPASVRFVELAQQGSAFARGEGSLADRFGEIAGLDATATRTALAAMRLGADQVSREPDSLSPGELTRAELALLARRGAACLLLDEPSNHLDIDALEVLEEALEGWPGALVVASHDRAFRERLRFDRSLDLG